MSKKHGHRKRRKARAKAAARDPAALLGAIASALNAAEQAGMRVRFLPGPMIHTFSGVVLPPEGKAGWTARVFGWLPQSPPDDGDED